MPHDHTCRTPRPTLGGERVRSVVATCLADPSDRRVRRAATRWPALGEHGPALADAVRRDRLGGGNRVSKLRM